MIDRCRTCGHDNDQSALVCPGCGAARTNRLVLIVATGAALGQLLAAGVALAVGLLGSAF